ncbi:MAG: hypothetical protein Q7S60_04085 [bacterium]|nr:hypothetical protein [bacterium]
MIKKKFLGLFGRWIKGQKTVVGEKASQEFRQIAKLGQSLVVMELS